MPFEDSPEAVLRAKTLSGSLQLGREKLSAMNHTLGFINPHVVHRVGHHTQPLGCVDRCVPCLFPRDHTRGSPLSSQGHRDSQIWGRVQCFVSWPHIMLFYHDALNGPLLFSVFLSEYTLHRGPLFTVPQRVTLIKRNFLTFFSSWSTV